MGAVLQQRGERGGPRTHVDGERDRKPAEVGNAHGDHTVPRVGSMQVMNEEQDHEQQQRQQEVNNPTAPSPALAPLKKAKPKPPPPPPPPPPPSSSSSSSSSSAEPPPKKKLGSLLLKAHKSGDLERTVDDMEESNGAMTTVKEDEVMSAPPPPPRSALLGGRHPTDEERALRSFFSTFEEQMDSEGQLPQREATPSSPGSAAGPATASSATPWGCSCPSSAAPCSSTRLTEPLLRRRWPAQPTSVSQQSNGSPAFTSDSWRSQRQQHQHHRRSKKPRMEGSGRPKGPP